MKKAFFLPLFLAGLALPSCGNAPASSSAISSVASSEDSSAVSSVESSASSSAPAEVSKLKDLLSKQDVSPILTKMFTSRFTQNYKTYTSGRGEEESETRFYTYSGAGWFGCLYEVGEEAYAEAEALGNPDFFDYLSRGKGSYGMLQQGSLVSYLQETEGEEGKKSLQNMEFSQTVEARFTETDVQVVNSLATKPTIGEGGYDVDDIQSFNGIIDKGTLFDTITVRAFSNIFARTNIFDGQRSCEILDRIYFATVKELGSKSDAELADFIAENDIRIEEEEETILVHFVVGGADLRATLDEHDIIPGTFEGTLSYEKESGKFSAYEYKIAHVNNESEGKDGNVHTTSMEFAAEGYSWNQRYEKDLYIDPNPTVYDDAEAFLEDVEKEVIPPLF